MPQVVEFFHCHGKTILQLLVAGFKPGYAFVALGDNGLHLLHRLLNLLHGVHNLGDFSARSVSELCAGAPVRRVSSSCNWLYICFGHFLGLFELRNPSGSLRTLGGEAFEFFGTVGRALLSAALSQL